ncbi:hypothetical protein BFP72_03745 [Reichenbachiella sp. 5M10]|uniref:hypothetical protein n=1 Tax=Reichenbachiella sp. 5M10 TaxID=1889772 RepID=UPI000C145772|nr:hypothetical protein [Reichenbachiella sp. 5M10]PIB34584.1 hypothetical protein BFP72_03745 [Reichenbachiella sp. 5M10]
MSTTFEIIPVEKKNITFRQVIDLSEQRINSFFDSLKIKSNIKLEINLHEISERYVKEVDLDSEFFWTDNEYVWFTINGIPGGTDAYCERIKDDFDESNPWGIFEEMILNNKTIKDFELKIDKSKKLNIYWRLRRSAGQRASINVAYGIISASIAELTGGFIWTEDGAWNFSKFPAEPHEFYKWYFKPDSEDDGDLKEWAISCLGGIAYELK